MSKDTGPGDSGPRWWEIRDRREPDEGGYGHLVTGARERSRPERSLSVGAEPVTEPSSRWRGVLGPVASLVAVGALIVGGIYGIPMLTSTDSATTPPAGADRGLHGNGGSQPFPPAPPGTTPDGGDGALPPLGGSAEGPNAPDGGTGGTDGDSGIPSGGTPGGSDAGSGSNSDRYSDEGTESPAVKLDGPAPPAPGPQQGGEPVPGTGGCSAQRCTVTQRAPVYLAETSKPRAHAAARQYSFLCQSDGSSYSVGNRSSNWWAWVGNDRVGAWIPVVFLAGAPDDGPVPGLRVCGNAPRSTAPSNGGQ